MATNFTMDTYARGLRQWSLTSPEARPVRRDHRVDLDRPRRFAFLTDGRPGSAVTAAHGEMNTRKRKDMVAGGGVVMVSTEGVRLESDWMRYDKKSTGLCPRRR